MENDYKTLIEILRQFKKEKAEISWMIKYNQDKGFTIIVKGEEK